MKGQYELAIADLTRTIQINPKIPQAFNNRANAYRASGNLEAAITDYSELAKLAPASAFAFEQRANFAGESRPEG
jgi:tetratricopeptide (TPR) repeat protein